MLLVSALVKFLEWHGPLCCPLSPAAGIFYLIPETGSRPQTEGCRG